MSQDASVLYNEATAYSRNNTYEVHLSNHAVHVHEARNFAISPAGDLSLYDDRGGLAAYAANVWERVLRR